MGNINFDAKIADYRNYLVSRADVLKLDAGKIDEQVKRYQSGLMHDRQKATNLLFGKEYGKELAKEKATKENGKKALDYVKNHQAKGVDAKAIDEMLGIGKAKSPKQVKEYAKMYEGLFEKEDAIKKDALKKAEEIGKKKFTITAEQIDQRFPKVKDLSKSEYKAQSKMYKELFKNAPKSEKASGKILSQVKTAMKGKKGKFALAGGLLAAGLGLFALLKSDKKEEDKSVKDDKVLSTPTIEEGIKDKADTTVTELPSLSSEEKPQDKNTEEAVSEDVKTETPAKSVEISGDTYTVKPGDNVWNIAKAHLKELNKDVKGYEPSDKEILKHTNELMKINGLKYEKDNYRVIIRPGQVISFKANEEAVEETVEEKVEEPVKEPVEEKVEEPVEETVEEPVEEKVEEPVEEKVEEPVEEPVEETVEEEVDETSEKSNPQRKAEIKTALLRNKWASEDLKRELKEMEREERKARKDAERAARRAREEASLPLKEQRIAEDEAYKAQRREDKMQAKAEREALRAESRAQREAIKIELRKQKHELKTKKRQLKQDINTRKLGIILDVKEDILEGRKDVNTIKNERLKGRDEE